MKLKGSETEKNLKKALQGEALAHLKYQFYKSKLSNISKEIENELNEIVHNEKEHGKIWFKLLNNNEIPDDIINLLDAIKGETYEAKDMYPKFGDIAEEEGFNDIALLFREVGKIENEHSEKFNEILTNLEKNSLFEHNEIKEWKCLNCGYVYNGTSALEECPICKHPKKYFSIKEQ